MSTEIKKKSKSGRTPEQQAARDARKAASKAALAAKHDAIPADEAVAESSSAAQAKMPPVAVEQEASSGDETKETEGDEDLLEIDVDAPEPLSKAEARAAKKRQKKGLPEVAVKKTTTKTKRKREDDELSDPEDEPASEEKKPKTEETGKPRYQNSVWVGNLAYKTTVDTLKSFFIAGIEKQGAQSLGAITRVNMPKKPGKGAFASNRGFAYVDFATPELQQIALDMSEGFFEGRKLLIKKGDDHTVKPDAVTPRPEKSKIKMEPGSAAILKKQIHPESATLFVGNLPFDATEEALRDMIEEHAAEASGSTSVPAQGVSDKVVQAEEAVEAEAGTMEEDEGAKEDQPVVHDKRGGKVSGLRKVRLGAFEDTGRCKGFAFLDFHTPESATKTLINRKNHFFGGRRLNVQYASEEATKRSGGARNAPVLDATRRPRTFNKPGEAKQPRTYSEDTSIENAEPEHTYDAREDAPPAAKKDQRGKRWEATGRPRPGAALAMAKREKVGIVKAEGAKIVFD